MYRVDPHLVAVTRWLEDLRHQTMDGTKICDDCLLYTDGNRCWHRELGQRARGHWTDSNTRL